jgi:Ca2+-binding RTX toxin-like protein
MDITGTNLPDTIEGTIFEDTIFGEGGDDSIYGYGESDELHGGDDDDHLFGGGSRDELYGEEGNDYLDGEARADYMEGGNGDDTYVVDDAGDTVAELVVTEVSSTSFTGNDTVRASIHYTLPALVENLILIGSDPLNGTGNNLANVITGNNAINILTGGDGDDTIDGGIGADDMRGGQHNDTFIVNDAGDIVREDLGEGVDTILASVTRTLGNNIENLTLTGAAAIDGTGNGLGNVLRGNGGANVLTGRAGNDTYHVGVSDTVVEVAAQGMDTVVAQISYTLGANLERLTLAGAALNGTGNGGVNLITGNARNNRLSGLGGDDELRGGEGNDTLDGGIGNDRMAGAAGNDTYHVDSIKDVVTELGPRPFLPGLREQGRSDHVISTIDYTLAENVENLTLAGKAAAGTGNRLDNIITGNGFANTLSGDRGNDTLIGGAKSDTLRGGLGNDTFQFTRATDGGTTGDSIIDFVAGQDHVALDNTGFGIAGSGSLASRGIAFVVGSAATGTGPAVIFNNTTDEVWWDADGSGAGAARLLAHLALPSSATLSASDFLIV